MIPDAWSAAGCPAPPAAGGGAAATKWRISRAGKGPPIHFVTRGSHRHAAVSSMHWVADFWSTRRPEQRAVRAVLARLRAVGVAACSCHGQHHALIFQDSPEELAARLADDVHVRRAICGPERRHGPPLRVWCREYIRAFGPRRPSPLRLHRTP